MANSHKNIVITPNKGSSANPTIVFSGADETTPAQNVTLTVLPTNGGTLSITGAVGSMLNLSNALSASYGSLFSVNDVSGMAVFEIFSAGGVQTASTSTLRTGLNMSGPLNVSSGTSYFPTLNVTSSLNVTGTNMYAVAGSFTSLLSANSISSSTMVTAGTEIRANGNITAYYSSDQRLKTNIQPIPNALQKVSQISGVTFDWTDQYIEDHGGEDGYFIRKRDAGVIAQEVMNVLPEIVAERKDGTLAVKYDKIVALLIEAIKEQNDKIQDLETKVANLINNGK